MEALDSSASDDKSRDDRNPKRGQPKPPDSSQTALKKTVAEIKMEESTDEIEYEQDDYFNAFDGGETWDEYLGEPEADAIVEPPNHLISKDYTLNSPLLPDEIDEFVKFYRGQSCNRYFDRGQWSERAAWLDASGVERWSVKNTSEFHRWMIEHIRLPLAVEEFGEFINKVDEEASDSFLLLSTYIEEWCGLGIEFVPRARMDHRTKRYGAIHLVWHKIILMLNCSTEVEAAALEQSIGAEVTRDGKDWCFRYRVSDEVEFLIGKGVVYCSAGGQLLDRSMALLVKDLCGGRFQTYLHCEYKQHPEYPRLHLWKIHELFEAGDVVISEYGSRGYEIIAMLEPTASLRMHELASQTRPMLPSLNRFKEHIADTRRALLQEFPLSGEFFEVIFSYNTIECLLTAFGAFRLWGHPFINYQEGLTKLRSTTTALKEIDREYAEVLASDLAYKVLHTKFVKERTWYVDQDLLPADHPLAPYVASNQWPSAGVLRIVGDTWHQLPLKQCFEVPEVINPSTIYSDKFYSPTRSELIAHLQQNPGKALRSLSVLQSLIEKPATNWKDLLQSINDDGLDVNDLIIALKAKEREIKDKGRFYALMSWKLREYFVVTEHLIKLHFVPLFKGLTMSDDFTTVTTKMLRASQGQSGRSYLDVCIANHVDYARWNNHQRGEANDPVFRVMGIFLGYPNLITRTHEFFAKSFIYYKHRVDRLSYNGSEIVSDPPGLYCWYGQAGGLEGLRQKGWSVTNYLCIERQARIRSTAIRVLAQGDNQVLCTRYQTRPHRTTEELQTHLNDIFQNNERILESIIQGTKKLGLVINKNETLQSASMLIYGKNIVYRGTFRCLAEKRLGRILCTTNDQLPTLASVGGAVVTNCLLICHYSDTPLNAMIQYNWLATYSRIIMELHNPAIKGPIKTYQKDWSPDDLARYRLFSVYLDPALGGVGGVSPGRFLMRQFPDPVTESLAFWKTIGGRDLSAFHSETALIAGNPRIAKYSLPHFEKLIDNPTGLNLPRGLSAMSVLRDRVRDALIQSVDQIGNRIIQSAICRARDDKTSFIHYLASITPCFPRFISEYYSSTYMGLVEQVVGLFENSRTIRSNLRNKFGKGFDEIVIRAEVTSIESLRGQAVEPGTTLWNCSSTHADQLRRKSWDREIIGATVPHPYELIRNFERVHIFCQLCDAFAPYSDYVAAICPVGPPQELDSRGPYSPYLGSRTSETTSVMTPWEKETRIPLIRRSVALRDVIGWFIPRDSILANTILLNIRRLCGVDADVQAPGYSRTGSALHRFRCARQSNGGFSGVSPNLATWFILTTDTLRSLGRSNFDFMHQALLVYSQVTASTVQSQSRRGATYHFHVSCRECLREIAEPQLTAEFEYDFPDISEELNAWKPSSTDWFTVRPVFKVPHSDWTLLSSDARSYHIGRITGFGFADRLKVNLRDQLDLFPIILGYFLEPKNYLAGIVDGVYRASALSMTHRRSAAFGEHHSSAIEGSFHSAVKLLCKNLEFLVLMESKHLRSEIQRGPHRISPGYPSSREDQGAAIVSYLMDLFRCDYRFSKRYNPRNRDIWIFSDFLSLDIAGPFVLSEEPSQIYFRTKISASQSARLRAIANLDGQIRGRNATSDMLEAVLSGRRVFSTDHELRSAAKTLPLREVQPPEENANEEFAGPTPVPAEWVEVPYVASEVAPERFVIPDIRDPTMSGLRLAQLATGAFYKIISVLKTSGIAYKDFICGGDGSGGCTACLLRRSIHSQGIFNSLMSGDNLSFRGSTPAPPPAIEQMPYWIARRCVNLQTCWEQPSDLAQPETWENFASLRTHHRLEITLILLDMELTSPDVEVAILENLRLYGLAVLSGGGSVIYKTYLGHLFNSTHNCLTMLGSLFEDVKLYQSELSGSYTSEVYAVFSRQRTKLLTPLYPDWRRLRLRTARFRCFASTESEFARALTYFNHDSLENIPTRYLQDPRQEFTEILRQLGVDPSVCSALSDAIFLSPSSRKASSLLAVMLYAGENLFPIRRVPDTQGAVPSDQRIYKWMAFLMGSMLWISLATEDKILYYKLHRMNQGSITFYYNVIRDGRPQRETLQWSICNPLHHSKSLRMDRHQASQARVLRCLTRMCADKQEIDLDVVDFLTKTFPYVKRYTEMVRYSGTLELLSEAYPRTDEKVITGFEEDDLSDTDIELES